MTDEILTIAEIDERLNESYEEMSMLITLMIKVDSRIRALMVLRDECKDSKRG